MNTVLFIITSATMMAGKPSGFWYEELSTPYYAFKKAGYEVVFVSPKGGKVVYVAESKDESIESVAAFLADEDALGMLENTELVENVDFAEYAAIYFPGGHGAVVDLPEDQLLADKLGKAFDAGQIIGAVCHGPGGLVLAKRADGKSILYGKRVNGFTNSEEEAVGQTDMVPFLLETRMRELGGVFEKGEDWKPYAIRDGNLVMGQNPASSTKITQLMIQAIEE